MMMRAVFLPIILLFNTLAPLDSAVGMPPATPPAGAVIEEAVSPEPEGPPNTTLYVLMYHLFVDDGLPCNEWTVTKSRFREDVQWLTEHGYTTVLPRELAAGEALPEKPVLIT